MGRELKRVALDFEWPLKKAWKGYINSAVRAAQQCVCCKGLGYSPEAEQLKDRWYGYVPFQPEERGSVPFLPDHPAVHANARHNVERSPDFYGRGPEVIEREAIRLCDLFNDAWSHHLNEDDVAALLAAGRLTDLTHEWTPERRWQPKVPAYVPTPEEVNVWSLSGMGHDGINQWVCVQAECARLGVSDTCGVCLGEGCWWPSPDAKAASEAWARTEPPSGEGYQMWETVTEGSPISPVFATAEDLARWLAGNRQGTVDEATTVEQWMGFILGPGWAPSAVVGPNGLLTLGLYPEPAS